MVKGNEGTLDTCSNSNSNTELSDYIVTMLIIIIDLINFFELNTSDYSCLCSLVIFTNTGD